MKKEDINQAHFKAPLVSATDKPSIDFKNIGEDTFYQNSEVFPPRGSFINISEDVLFGTKDNLLDNNKKDDSKDNLDLYK